jgi:hypothetical protein
MRTCNIITLTTIPPRFQSVLPTLQSLAAQDADISRVILTLPKTYQRRNFEAVPVPALPDGVEILETDADLGPATKILPVLKEFQGQDVRLLYCDDDRIYHRDWAARLIAQSEARPDMCIADVGDPVSAIDLRADWDVPRHHRLNALSLGLYGKRHRRHVRSLIPDTGQVDIAKGYGGVLVRPDFLDAEAFRIPDGFWAVDDIWLSGHMARLGVRIHKTGPTPKSAPTRAGKLAALLDRELEGRGRDKLNRACVDYFRQTYGVWGGRGPDQGKT